MSNYASAREQRRPIVTGIRRVESMALAALAFGPLVGSGAEGAPFSLALLAAAVVLMPRQQEITSATMESLRLDTFRRLLTQGEELQAHLIDIHSIPESAAKSRAFVQARLDIIVWIDEARRRLENYPEFSAIFNDHGGENLLLEFEGRVQRLTEIVNLAHTSRRLNLTI